MSKWQPIETAPRDGTKILVWYDADADPYYDGERLTEFATHAEGGDFLDGSGLAVASWEQGWHESEDEYGSGYWMPAYWFAWFNGDCELVVNPTHWMPLPDAPL